jgi:DNA-binding transcriptional MerR regulator
MQFVPKKLYYKIGEVCEILGVEAHVLRYWESEFPSLSPPKNRSGQRTYRPKDIELLLEIRRLLYEEGFTLAGARRHLGVKGRADRAESASDGEVVAVGVAAAADQTVGPPSDRIRQLREELENILTLLRRQ